MTELPRPSDFELAVQRVIAKRRMKTALSREYRLAAFISFNRQTETMMAK